MAIFPSPSSRLRVRVLPRVPSRIDGAAGISATKSGGVYTIAQNWPALGENTSPNFATALVVSYDTANQVYQRTPLDDLFAGYQVVDPTLTALAALDATAGLLEQTGADLFTKRAIGVATPASIPTLADADARYQPLDADLTALAALSGTNTIYYRSAANTWSPVTIGSNLTFTAGTLAATGGAGVGLTLIDVQVFSSSGTWTKPSGCTAAEVFVWGGGGSGGSAATASASQGSGGGGGGGGGHAYEFITSGLGASETVTVGAGGAAPAAGANPGNTGGTSSFGSFCSATGGAGGTSTVSTAANQMVGGAPGSGSGGSVNMTGSGGDVMVINVAASNLRFGGQGGDAPGGGGGGGAAVNAAFSAGSVAGTAGGAPGGGGAGAMSYNGGASAQGGAGGAGLVIVKSYG